MKELANQGKKQTTDSLSEIMNIDRLVHSPARLSILTYLSVVEEGDAVYLLNQTGLTWGNLSANVTRLQEAGYIEVVKEFKDKKPHTLLKLTDKGRKAFHDYQNKMKGLLDIKSLSPGRMENKQAEQDEIAGQYGVLTLFWGHNTRFIVRLIGMVSLGCRGDQTPS